MNNKKKKNDSTWEMIFTDCDRHDCSRPFLTMEQLFHSVEQRFWCFTCCYASLSVVKLSVFSCTVNISVPQAHCLTWRCPFDPLVQSDALLGFWFPVKFLGWELYSYCSQDHHIVFPKWNFQIKPKSKIMECLNLQWIFSYMV